ncbi:MAG: VCBS repeat-containing protein [Bacteroidota bacterium]
MSRKCFAFLLCVLLVIVGCEQAEQSVPLFELIPADESGVLFVNRLRESPSQNVLNYEYFYNGAGLAVADFNGDQWPDIYMVSNLEANALYLNQQNFVFQEVAQISKARGKRGFATGVSIVDINGDGRLDLYICKSGRFTKPDLRRNELLVNMGNNEAGIPLFEEQAKQYGLDIPSYATQASFFDYDKDGDLDMFLINHGIDTYDIRDIDSLQKESSQLMGEMLFRNEDGFFRNVTESAGIINNKLGFGLGLGIADLNNDDYPDVYVSNDYSGKDHLYINQRDGSFREMIAELTNQISFYAMGNDIGDVNNDGWQDIVNLDMVAAENYGIKTAMSAMSPEQFRNLVDQGEHHQYMFNSLLLNNGMAENGQLPHFSNIGQLAGISNTDWSWAPLLFDMDNDGWQDLFVTNGIKRNIRNKDAVKLVKQLNQRMLASNNEQEKVQLIQQMLGQFPYHQKPNYFFRNQSQLSFVDLTARLGLDSLLSVSSGAAYADLDRDGDLDLVVNNADQAAFILRNNANQTLANHSLSVSFQGAAQNPLGIGAKVTVEGAIGIQSKELYTSRGYKSSVEPMLHFGLGLQDRVNKLTVRWPDGKVQEIQDVAAGRIVLDHREASTLLEVGPQSVQTIFSTSRLSVPSWRHEENEFDDFSRESLLPHKMSNMGPCASRGDVNQDGLEDVFVGGARGQAAQLLLQQADGSFVAQEQAIWTLEKEFEDVASCFFDADLDGDLDLLVGGGSNEWMEKSDAYLLRFYENTGGGTFQKNTAALPDLRVSAGVLAVGDWDGDGDQDVFVGGRQNPGAYPQPCNSFLLKNESQQGRIRLENATQDVAPFLDGYGMVTDASWQDLNGDGRMDLVTVGEWMSPKVLINNGVSLLDYTEGSQLSEEKGWWYSVAVADFDGDGDQDLLAGNLGLNYKYKASKEQPFEVFAKDFDENGTQDIVLSYYEKDELVPLRGRECSSNQMPFIKEKFVSYDAFGKATLTDVFGEKQLAASTHFEANNFAHCYFENKGNAVFEKRVLPIEIQLSSINAFAILDANEDGFLDFLCAGNLYGSEVETPRNDASFGQLLYGDGQGNFTPVPFSKSGFRTKGEVRDLLMIENKQTQQKQILVAKNNDALEWHHFHPPTAGGKIAK